MRYLALWAAAAILSAGLALPHQVEATPFGASAAVRLAIDLIDPIERSACGLYPTWYPRSWAVFARGWGCYAYYPYDGFYQPRGYYRFHPRYRAHLRSAW